MGGKKLSLDDIHKFAENVASRNGWLVNPDTDFRDSVVEGLFNNYGSLGYMLCPCRESWEDREKDRDVICPCDYCSDDIAEFGHCYCGLYVSEEFAKSGEEAGSLPERRDSSLIPD